MSVEVKVPRLAESIADATLAEWLKGDGEAVRADEPIATLETDKAAVEIAATGSGVLRQMRKVGDVVHVDDLLGRIEPGAEPARPPARPVAAPAVPVVGRPKEALREGPAATTPFGPAVRRLIEEHGLDPARIVGSGRDGRLLKEDVLRHVEALSGAPGPTEPAPPAAPGMTAVPSAPAPAATPAAAPAPAESVCPAVGAVAPAARTTDAAPGERAVPMSRIRQRIAERLVEAQHTAAILTTFNEVDMSAVMELRARWRESFEQRHGVRLGLMSFFARACVLALHEIPEVNAEIRGGDMVFREFVHLGVAVQTERGLVVPVIHDAHQLSFAGIEREIAGLADKARDHRLSLDDLAGGTFTLSNGGVFGSLLSTPILNPPQSGILGMHKIEKRPVVMDDQVMVRPMMYLALSYDHRIVDGRQSVTFLVRVKERLEHPERMLLDV